MHKQKFTNSEKKVASSGISLVMNYKLLTYRNNNASIFHYPVNLLHGTTISQACKFIRIQRDGHEQIMFIIWFKEMFINQRNIAKRTHGHRLMNRTISRSNWILMTGKMELAWYIGSGDRNNWPTSEPMSWCQKSIEYDDRG